MSLVLDVTAHRCPKTSPAGRHAAAKIGAKPALRHVRTLRSGSDKFCDPNPLTNLEGAHE